MPDLERHKELMRTQPMTEAECIGEMARVIYESPWTVDRAWVIPPHHEYGYHFEIQFRVIFGNTARCHNDAQARLDPRRVTFAVTEAFRLFNDQKAEWEPAPATEEVQG